MVEVRKETVELGVRIVPLEPEGVDSPLESVALHPLAAASVPALKELQEPARFQRQPRMELACLLIAPNDNVTVAAIFVVP